MICHLCVGGGGRGECDSDLGLKENSNVIHIKQFSIYHPNTPALTLLHCDWIVIFDNSISWEERKNIYNMFGFISIHPRYR